MAAEWFVQRRWYVMCPRYCGRARVTRSLQLRLSPGFTALWTARNYFEAASA